MRVVFVAILVGAGAAASLAACISTPETGTGGGGGGPEAGAAAEASMSTGDDASSTESDAGTTTEDAPADAGDASCVLWVDDAGITHGCNKGSQGPGDKDDGGGAPAPPPPTVSPDAGDLPLGSSCWDNAQCESQICFLYSVRGTFCTQRCWTNADCPPPANGCNGMGVCRFGDGGN